MYVCTCASALEVRNRQKQTTTLKEQQTDAQEVPQRHRGRRAVLRRLLHQLMQTGLSNSAQEAGREAERQIWLASQRKGCNKVGHCRSGAALEKAFRLSLLVNVSTIWFTHLLLAKLVNGPVRSPNLPIASEEQRLRRDSWHSLSLKSHIALGGPCPPFIPSSVLLLYPVL